MTLVGLAFLVAGYVAGYVGAARSMFAWPQLVEIRQAVFGEPALRTPADRVREELFVRYAAPSEVVFVGDSIVERIEWSDLFPALRVANRGISADTTAGVLARLDGVVATQAKIAVLHLGVNDGARRRPPADIFADYERIVATLHAAGMSVIVLTTMPCTAEAEWRCGDNATIDALNDRLRSLADRPAVTVIELAERVAPGGELDPRYASDGVHPSTAAVELIRILLADPLTAAARGRDGFDSSPTRLRPSRADA